MIKATFMKNIYLTLPVFLFLGLGLLLTSCASNPQQVKTKHAIRVPQRPDVPLVMNEQVEKWISYFQGPGRAAFERYLSRSGRYIPMMKEILRENGLPEDLVYLALIESGYNPRAYSRARATGAWQFIHRTGSRYGLTVNDWIDERRDPEKSTVAAAKYLIDLYERFDDWYLATASYNAGEGKIDRAIQRYKTEDFWELAQRRYLRAETKNYVPKLIAATLIAKEPKKYGFHDIQYEDPISYEKVTLEGPLDLRIAAQCAEIDYEEMEAFNPELLHGVTPPHESDYQLRVPSGRVDQFQKKYASLSASERLNGFSFESVKKGKRDRGLYRAKKGDTIGKISHRTGVSVKVLRQYNPRVRWGRLKTGTELRLYVLASPVRSKKNRHRILAENNTATPRKLRHGKTIRIPKAVSKEVRPASIQPEDLKNEPSPAEPNTLDASSWVPSM